MASSNPPSGSISGGSAAPSKKNEKVGATFVKFAAAVAAAGAFCPQLRTSPIDNNSGGYSSSSSIGGRIARPLAMSMASGNKDQNSAELDGKVDDIARMIGQIADRVLQFVGNRMPGLETWTISTLDTIFAPRLVLRYALVALL